MIPVCSLRTSLRQSDRAVFGQLPPTFSMTIEGIRKHDHCRLCMRTTPGTLAVLKRIRQITWFADKVTGEWNWLTALSLGSVLLRKENHVGYTRPESEQWKSVGTANRFQLL
jgi:hypothetical protein